MKNVYEKPEVEIISLEPMDSITNGLEGGDAPTSMGGGSDIV